MNRKISLSSKYTTLFINFVFLTSFLRFFKPYKANIYVTRHMV